MKRFRTLLPPALLVPLMLWGNPIAPFTIAPRAFAAPQTAQLNVVPGTANQIVGRDFDVDIRLDTGGQAVGAVQVAISYSNNLEFVASDATGSVFDLELIAQNPSNNRIQFSRIRFDTGYSGEDGVILRLTFLPLAVGEGTITISTVDSEVIAFADASNILSAVWNATYGLIEGGGGSSGGGGGRRLTIFFEYLEKESEEDAATAKEEEAMPTVYHVPCLEKIAGPLPSRRTKLIVVIDRRDAVLRDIPIRTWYARPIAQIVQAGLALGYRDKFGILTELFGPNNPVTYAELAKIALSAPGKTLPLPTSPPQNQSALDHWSEMHIAAIEEQGISTYATFPHVDEDMKRGAVVQTILEALAIPIGFAAAHFEDVPANHKHSQAIATATDLGIIQGDTDEDGNLTGTFRPDDSINRAEVAKVVAKAIAIVCE